MINNPKKILIIKLGAIGDLLMATPVMELIRQTYPNSEITLLVGKWASEIVVNNPNLDKVAVIDENIFWKKRIVPLIKLFFVLKKQNYDLVYVMHWAIYFNLFVYLLGIPCRIGFDRGGEGLFLNKKVHFVEGKKGVYIVNQYLNLITYNSQETTRQMKIYLTENEIIEARSWLEQHNVSLNEKYIAISPGGGENPKAKMFIRRWPVEHYVRLIDLIREKNNDTILILGGKTDQELGEQIINGIKNKMNVLNCTGKFTLRQTASLMKFCKVLVCNDSGLMHLGGAVNIPTVSIFGPTIPHDKIPYGEIHEFLYKGLSCSPCYYYGKYPNCQEMSCLRLISPEEVFEKLAKFVREKK